MCVTSVHKIDLFRLFLTLTTPITPRTNQCKLVHVIEITNKIALLGIGRGIIMEVTDVKKLFKNLKKIICSLSVPHDLF